MIMNIEIAGPEWKSIKTDLLLLPTYEKNIPSGDSGPIPENTLNELLSELEDTGEWKAAQGNSKLLIAPHGIPARRVGLIGMGSIDKPFDPGKFRTAVMNIIRAVHSAPIPGITAVIDVPGMQADICRMLFEGIFLGLFNPGIHKTSGSRSPEPESIRLVTSLDRKKAETILTEARILCEAVNLARRLSNEPGNLLYPELFVEETEKAVSGTGLGIEILAEKELREKGFGCLLAVAQGSRNKPRLCVLEHNPFPDKQARPLVLVGKGVTFDSGGISIKPSESMEDMRADKSGACSVLGAMLAIARLNIPSRVVGIMPLVENLPGGNAQRPGDVVKAYNGTTVEIINTDAEGRLILADAMAWAVETFNPSCLVDIATLTGACVVALGHIRAGLFSNNDFLSEELFQAAARGGEKLWRMPLDDDYKESLESKIADIKNCGERWGSAVTAAKFLESFIGETPWCHIDMAGTDFFRSGINKGTPPGFGVTSLVEFVKAMSGRDPKILSA